MSVIPIHCDKYRIDKEYWKKLDNNIHNKKLFYLNYNRKPNNIMEKYDEIQSKIYHDDIKVNAVGFVIKHEFKYYVITCYHVVKNCYNIYTKMLGNDVDLVIFGLFQELDLAILKLNDKFEGYYDDYMESIKFNLEIKIPNTDNNILLKTIIDNKPAELSSKNFSINNHSVLNILNPDILLIGCKFGINKNILSGLSGSPLLFEDKVIGFLSFTDNATNNIYFAISYLINYGIYLTKMKINPKTLKIKGMPVNIKIDGEKKIGLTIDNNINLEYKSNNSETGKIRFNKDIVITKVNNKVIDESGNIYFEEIDCYINPETYCFLTNNRTQMVEIEYFNLKKLDKNTQNEKVELVNYYDNSCISLNGYDKCLIYNNLVFMEINQNIIENIHLDNKFNILINEPHFSSNKTVILLDLLDSISNSTKNKKIKEINKMYKSKSNNLILQKINNCEFSCLEELESILSDIPDEKKILFNFQKDTNELINVLL